MSSLLTTQFWHGSVKSDLNSGKRNESGIFLENFTDTQKREECIWILGCYLNISKGIFSRKR